jgi:SAM-dependent methyltransferase
VHDSGPAACPACGFTEARRRGALAPLGGLLPLDDPGYLFDCPVCTLLFRRPYPPGRQLEEMYRSVPVQAWTAGVTDRADFRSVRSVLARHAPAGRVLDVGCFRGDFLVGLPDHYQKLGTEYSASARARAVERGISILGASLEEAGRQVEDVDAITMMDVAEHVPEPLRLIEGARSLLRRGGIMVISTGNADSWLWRRHPLDYWYYLSEHVSFFRASWFEWAAARLGLTLLAPIPFSYFPTPFPHRMAAALRTLAFEVARPNPGRSFLRALLLHLYPFSRARRWPHAPWMGWVKDHFVVTLCRG